MPIPEFHRWLEGLTKKLQDDPEVQERAYFRRDPGPSPDFLEHAVELRGVWVADCTKCGLQCAVEYHQADFRIDWHYCRICKG